MGELGPSLALLGLSTNFITSVPTEIGALTGLRVLDLGDNRIASPPSEVGALTSLEYLYLGNNFSDGCPGRVPDCRPNGQVLVRQPGIQLRQRRRRHLLLHRGRVSRQQLRRRPVRRAVLRRVTSSSASAPAPAPRP